MTDSPGLNQYESLKSHAARIGQWPACREKALAHMRKQVAKAKRGASEPVGWSARADHVLEPVTHRHVVLTMPRLLSRIFRKRRELLLDLAQCAPEAVAEYMKRQVGADARPGIVVSSASAGGLLQWHPHGHLLKIA